MPLEHELDIPPHLAPWARRVVNGEDVRFPDDRAVDIGERDRLRRPSEKGAAARAHLRCRQASPSEPTEQAPDERRVRSNASRDELRRCRLARLALKKRENVNRDGESSVHVYLI